jgi:Uma2 family endonuclease
MAIESAAPPVERRLFTVDEFFRMVEAGLFRPDERVELMDGEVVSMSPIGRRHSACIARLFALLGEPLGRSVVIWSQSPIRVGGRVGPQPDFVLLRARSDFYAGKDPDAGDVLLLVEVADSSMVYDRDTKMPRYAEAGIPEAWLVDLPRRRVLVYRGPAPGGYRSVQEVRPGDVLRPLAFPDLAVPMSDLLG